MSLDVLFMCPHSAGKSLAAATYFRAAAARHGIDASIAIAGPDPDDVVMPTVAAALSDQGYTIGWSPKLVTSEDTASAEMMVSIGCDHAEIPTDDVIVEWADVPSPSADLSGCLQAVHAHAEALAASLATA